MPPPPNFVDNFLMAPPYMFVNKDR
jgi:hypothetical protein